MFYTFSVPLHLNFSKKSIMANIGLDAKRAFYNFSGLGNYSRALIDALLFYNPQNQYLLFAPDKPQKKHFSWENHPSVSIVKPSGVAQKLPSFLWRSFGICVDIKAQKTDLYHGLSGELPLKKLSIPTVVTLHDVIFMRYPEFYNYADRKIYACKFKQACQIADKIVAISRQTADDAVRYLNADTSKIEIIYQGCDALFRQTPDTETLQRVQSKYRLPERFILAVGTIEPRKNLLNLIRALPDIDADTALVMVGKRTAYVDVITAAIRELRLESRVQMIHNADFEDFPAIYKSSQALVYISVFEGFGLPVLEGLTVGVPVITSNISSMPEAGGDAALYVQPDNPYDIAAQINTVLNDADLSKSMIERGFIHAQQFSEEVIAMRYVELYNSVLS